MTDYNKAINDVLKLLATTECNLVDSLFKNKNDDEIMIKIGFTQELSDQIMTLVEG